MLSFCAIALAHAHFLGAFHHRRNHNQDVVQQGNKNQQRRHNRQQNHLGLHIRIRRVYLAERFQKILELHPTGFKFGQRLMGFLHFADAIGQCARVNSREQFHIAFVPVIPVPVIRTLLAIGIHRQQDIVVQRAIFREVLENTFNGQFQPVHICIAYLLADALLYAAHLFGEAPVNHHRAPFAQHLHRVTGKNRPVKDLEEAGVGTDKGTRQFIAIFIQIGISVEHICGAGASLNAWHFIHKAHGNSAAHLAVIFLLALHGIPGIDSVHPVDVLVETVVGQLKEHLGNEHNAHSQSHTQGQDLD